MELEKLIRDSGFALVGRFDASGLEARDEVRDMCVVDTCHSYNRSWSCPPACGSIEHFKEKLKGYDTGYLFQTVAEMDDAFDYEGIVRGGKEHARRLAALLDRIDEAEGDVLVLGAGACSLCETCTYPDTPCRYPHKTLVSMEAAGLVVSDVCALADIPAYHGKGTVAFCGCVLVCQPRTTGPFVQPTGENTGL